MFSLLNIGVHCETLSDGSSGRVLAPVIDCFPEIIYGLAVEYWVWG